MEKMKIIKKSFIDGCILFEHPSFSDERGNFIKIFSDPMLSKYLNKKKIKQINYSSTKQKYSIRGLHYQNPYAEYKFVKCLEGKIFDVVVDLRKNSKSFLKHQNFYLNSNKPHILLIPENCAHGYQTLESNCKILYLHTNDYFPKFSKGYHYKDPLFKIKWPSKPKNISNKDLTYSYIDKTKYQGL
tara:strand:- start:228 stop:785 length:558 start_codon:yes stop_codon:yes gene_type:complete